MAHTAARLVSRSYYPLVQLVERSPARDGLCWRAWSPPQGSGGSRSGRLFPRRPLRFAGRATLVRLSFHSPGMFHPLEVRVGSRRLTRHLVGRRAFVRNAAVDLHVNPSLTQASA